jgi:hypothetical protein
MNEKKSAAMQRFKVDDSRNEFFTLFRYTPIEGLGYEKGVGRRDPSNIIKVDDKYYVWYTRITGEKQVGEKKADKKHRAFKWDLAEIWYATSIDGCKWVEKGKAVVLGEEGSFDDRSVFTPNILVTNDKYYLVYQAVKAPYTNRTRNVIAMAKADSHDGPWEKLDKPIIEPSKTGKFYGDERDKNFDWNNIFKIDIVGEWDSMKVHDPGFLVRDGKYWLYYKGQQIGRQPWESKWGVAIADHPEGPYKKHELNPITNSGHEIWVWPYKSGVAAMIDWAGPEKNTIQYAEDGINFEIVASVGNIPPAGGAFIPDLFTNTKNGKGFIWGLCHHCEDWDFIVRFDCDLMKGEEKNFDSVYDNYGKAKTILRNKDNFLLRRK